jgi:hypothetical protein
VEYRDSVPGVSEFREASRTARSPASPTSFYRAYSYDPSETPKTPDKVTLKVINGTDRAVLVWVDGVRYLLVEGQEISREVGPEFTWQVEGREKETGRAPAGKQAMSIVIDR